MRDPLRVLTISGALVLVVAFAPASAQTGGAAQESSSSATPPGAADGQAVQQGAPTNAPRPAVGMNGSLLGGSPETLQQPNAAATADSIKNSNAAKDSNAAQDPNAAKDTNAPQFDHGAPASGASSAAIPSADMKKAISILRRSTRDYAACTRVKTCSAYFDSFGVAFSFADGSIAAYSHEQRGPISGHDCVVKARTAMNSGERSLAVQWMMAAQSDILNRNWIADHPDAMLEALRTFRGWA